MKKNTTQQNISINAKEIDNKNSGELEMKTERVINTPFLKRWEAEKGWSYGIGIYRISNYFTTEEELEKNVEEKNWTTITGLISSLIDAELKLHGLKQ